MEMFISKKLAHLKPDEIEMFYQRYIQGDSVKKLLNEYKIDCSPSRLYSLFPAIKSKEYCCPYCQKAMYLKASSKTNQHIEYYFCQHCSHSMNLFNKKVRYLCTCQNCQEKYILEENQKQEEARKRIQEKYNIATFEPVSYEVLTLKEKCFLYGLYLLNHRENEFGALKDLTKLIPLTPTKEMCRDIMETLFQKRVLLVSPESETDAFIGKDYAEAGLLYVYWSINLVYEHLERLTMSELGQRLYEDLSNKAGFSYDEIISLIDEMLLQELNVYLSYQLAELNLPPAPDKVNKVFKDILNDFSVSEIYYFIKKSCGDALIFYSSGKSNGKKHAVNIIPSIILRLATRSKNEQWKKYYYNRHNRAPRSQFAMIFFDLFLKGETADCGFYSNRNEILKLV